MTSRLVFPSSLVQHNITIIILVVIVMLKFVKVVLATTLCLCICGLSAAAGNCTTPLGEEGICISVYNCTEVLRLIESYGLNAHFKDPKTLQTYQCGYDKTPLVCCASTIMPESSHVEDILFNKKYCGYQHFDDYVAPGGIRQANIDEFPWMASLLYSRSERGNDTEMQCSGALITDQFILTAAHCALTREFFLVRVRLGEHNVEQDVDCTDGDIRECNNPVEEFEIEKVIVHPKYGFRSKDNDIALLKLKKKVQYSDFIRPICLPFAGTKLARVGDILTSSGWGLGKYGGVPTKTKKKVLSELLELEKCQSSYTGVYVRVTNKQMCFLGKSDNLHYSCQGDSGGPIMFANKNQWHVEGIISYGKGCGSKIPEVDTNVVSYLEWIVQNIKPK